MAIFFILKIQDSRAIARSWSMFLSDLLSHDPHGTRGYHDGAARTFDEREGGSSIAEHYRRMTATHCRE